MQALAEGAVADLVMVLQKQHERAGRKVPAGLSAGFAATVDVSLEDKALAAEFNAADIRLYERLRADFDAKITALPPAFHQRLKQFTLINEKFNKVADLINKAQGLAEEDIVNPKQLWDYV